MVGHQLTFELIARLWGRRVMRNALFCGCARDLCVEKRTLCVVCVVSNGIQRALALSVFARAKRGLREVVLRATTH